MPSKFKIGLIGAAVVVAAGAALLLIGPKPVNDSTDPAAVAPGTEAPAAVAVPPAPEPASAEVAAPADLAPEMMEMKTALEAEYAERRKELPEAVAKPIDDDIGMIEGIAADLLAALASEPDNDSLKRMLVQTYRNEMKLLKKALHLSGDESDEYVESEEETPPTN